MSAPKRTSARRTGTAADRPCNWAELPPWKSLNTSLREMTELPESLKKVRRKILDYSAADAFDEMVKRGCDPHFLLCQLATVAQTGPNADREEMRFGFKRRQLPSIANRMRKCADEIQALDENGFPWLGRPRPFSFIPPFLRGYAHALDTAKGNPLYKPRTHASHNTAIAQLVVYVKHCTGTFHDNEVSELLNAVGKERGDGLGNLLPYMADALKVWRTEHKAFIRYNRDLLLPILDLLPAIGR